MLNVMTNGRTIVSTRRAATAEQLQREIEQRLKAAAETENRCHGCVTPQPVMLPERRGDGVNWTVVTFPEVPAGCAAFMMRILSEVMFAYDLAPPAPDAAKQKRSSMVGLSRRTGARQEGLPSPAGERPRPSRGPDQVSPGGPATRG